jgi:hypothetical protein
MRPLLLTLLLSRAAVADAVHVDFPYKGFFADVGLGVSVPIADGNYKQFADPTAVINLYAGWELALHKYFMLAPEIDLDLIPVNTNDGTFNANNVHFNASFFRFRFLVGARFAARFGKAEPFLRLGFGVDYFGGSVLPPVGNQRNFSSAGFAFKPSLGFQYEVAKYVVVGGEFSFPVSGQNFGDVAPFFNALNVNNRVVQFTAADFELAVFAGFRY